MLRFQLLCLALIVASAATAAEPQPTKTETVRLAITPAQENVPALRYRLLPPFPQQRSGNAAVGYGKVAMSYNTPADADVKLIEAFKLSPAEFDRRAKAGEFAELRSTTAYGDLKLAARRTYCDWDLPLREQSVFWITLPEQSELRRLARLAALEARLAAAEGKFSEAIEALQVGYAIARHNSATPTLINGLVSLSISAMMDQAVLQMAERPGSPSLYAALVLQPRPLVDWRPGVEGEMYSIDLAFPELREAIELDPAARDWNAVAGRLADQLLELGPLVSEGGPNPKADLEQVLGKAALSLWAVSRTPEMRAFLIARGVPKARVERMETAQLILAHSRVVYDELRDELFRWLPLDYADVKPRLESAEQRLKLAKGERREVLPLATLLLPAVVKVRHTHAKAERRQDVLLVVEALRLYAGAHEGKLPAMIDDLQAATPTKTIDCVTGKPWDYKLAGDTATLTLADERGSGDVDTLVYEITVAKPAK